MIFRRIDPPDTLQSLVREFWIVENPDSEPRIQKIIPDGFCELIVHYGAPYRIKLEKEWEMQERVLFSGQISKHFFLENTGATGIFGIKLWPDAPYRLFGTEMQSLTDRVIPFDHFRSTTPSPELNEPGLSMDRRETLATAWMHALAGSDPGPSSMSTLVRRIIKTHGMQSIEDLASDAGITRRHLEREFKKIVGLTPKYFSRIIQFNHIFESMQRRDDSWVDVALNSGYFDQSHFIRNFKAFTGESPTQYGFDEQNLANFFLRR